jgi:hypothetical protein
MSHGDHPDIRDTTVNGIDSSRHKTTPERFAEAYVVDEQTMRFVASPERWIESDTLIEVRA